MYDNCIAQYTNKQVLTQRLLQGRGVSVTLEVVIKKFEELYQGTEFTEGLYLTERLLVPKVCMLQCCVPHGSSIYPPTQPLLSPQGLLAELARRCPLGLAVVTGRPKKDCIKFLRTHRWVGRWVGRYIYVCVFLPHACKNST